MDMESPQKGGPIFGEPPLDRLRSDYGIGIALTNSLRRAARSGPNGISQATGSIRPASGSGSFGSLKTSPFGGDHHAREAEAALEITH